MFRTRRFVARRVLSALVAVLAAGAIGETAQAADLTVSAAASLTDAFGEIGRAFETQNPGTKVQLNFGASGALLQQIAKGAPVDVFASADEQTMDDAQKQDLVDAATRVDFVRNSLVVIVPSDAKVVPAALADLGRADIKRVAIGQPASVPVGRYTKSVLEQANLWSTVEPKMIGAQSVRQALDYVARGEVDAGFVYSTDAATMTDRVRTAFMVPTPQPILYPIAAMKGAKDLATAQRFVRFVASPAAQAVLARYGFAKP
jgi:molybdate transport system substrate-binding protein